jgi:hypothetical protein
MHLVALSLALVGDDPARVDPDRPNIANSTDTVAAGAVQIEAGVDVRMHGKARADSFRIATPMIVRIGVHEKAELRLFDGDPYRWSQGTPGARQQGEISLGAKLKLWQREQGTKVSFGLQPQLIPVSPRTNAIFWAPLPAVVLLNSVEPGDWHLDFNLGFKMKPTRHGRCCDVEALFAASFARSLADARVRLWAEAYTRYSLGELQLGELSGDAGIMVTPTRRLALDVAALVGHAGGALQVAVIGGMSLRIGPRIRRTT